MSRQHRWLLPSGVVLLYLVFTVFYLLDTKKYLADLQTMLFVWPVIGLLLIFSVVVLIQEYKKNKRRADKEKRGGIPAGEETVKAATIHIFKFDISVNAFLIIVVICYVLLMQCLGFILATLIIPFLWMYAFGIRSIKVLLLVPFILTSVLYIGLDYFMLIPLPPGILSAIL